MKIKILNKSTYENLGSKFESHISFVHNFCSGGNLWERMKNDVRIRSIISPKLIKSASFSGCIKYYMLLNANLAHSLSKSCF